MSLKMQQLREPKVVALAIAVLVGSFQVSAHSNQADAIVAQARQAIGGDARLRAVRSLSAKGTVQTERGPTQWGIPTRVVTNLRVDFLLPDRFLTTLDWPLSFFRRLGGFNGEVLIERSQSSGMWRDVAFGDGGKQAYATQLAARRRECARYLVAWLLMAPEKFAVDFTEPKASANAEPGMDIVDVTGANGFAVRLFFLKDKHQLARFTYREPPRAVSGAAPAAPGAPPAAAAAPPLFNSLEPPEATDDEVSVVLDDFHVDDGILFPHTMRIKSAALREEWRISTFKVNPPLDAKYFERK